MYPGKYAALAPGKPAVVMGGSGEVLTYGELNERSMRLAQLFVANGLAEGDRVAILAGNHVRYFEAYWAAIRAGLYVVPTMCVRMLKLPEDVKGKYGLSSLRKVLHAAAPCPPEVKRAMIEWWGPIIDEYYSSTEGNLFTYIDSPEWLAHPGSVGRPRLGTPHVCDDAGNELPAGEVGVIYSHRPDSTFEYLGDEEKTTQTRHPAHPEWTTVGDMGYLDADGYLYLTDRKNFMIISGGVNIYPAEIEGAFALHPAVADVAVFGLPDAEMGEFVQAVIQPADGLDGTPGLAAELTTFARQHIAGYKVPKRIDFRGSLPRTPTGKLAKGPLRAEYLDRAASAASEGRHRG